VPAHAQIKKKGEKKAKHLAALTQNESLGGCTDDEVTNVLHRHAWQLVRKEPASLYICAERKKKGKTNIVSKEPASLYIFATPILKNQSPSTIKRYCIET